MTKSKWVLKMVYYMDCGWRLSSNVCCWMEDIDVLVDNKKCWEKVFVWDKFKNRVIDIR